MNEAGPVIVFANFLSDLAVDLGEGHVLEQWAQQAPRKAWLLRPQDVFVTPGALSREFLTYVAEHTGVAVGRATVVEVPPAGPVALAQAVRQAGLVEQVRVLARALEGAALLPTALDASALGFARDLAVTVHPYPTIDAAAGALSAAMLLNTKAGFRDAAEQVDMRLPAGRVCRRPEVERVVREMLQQYERVVVKPDRSAAGHGLRFVGRDDLATAGLVLDPVGGPQGVWVVEEFVDVAESVSIQMENSSSGTRALFSGAMRTVRGSFTGYASPLPPSCAHVAGELREWGMKLGRHLSDLGYLGPFGLDGLVATDGVLYASESNVRRTATTTPHAMVTRLTAESSNAQPSWSVSKGRTRRPLGFEDALHRLRQRELAFDPARGEGVVLYADAPPDGHSWRYAVIAAHADGVRQREERVAQALALEAGA